MRRLVAIALLLFAGAAAAAGVPEACRQYQRLLTQEAHNVMGVDAPVASLGAQLQQESGCRADARSGVGAAGLAQFMPATAADISKNYRELGAPAPLDPRWAIGAQVRYMRDLARAAPGRTECDSYAFALASYNGGLGWLQRDQAQARRLGRVADVWFGQVELAPDPRRAPAAIAENRGYPRRILLTITPIFVAGGWGRGITCTQGAQQ